MVCSGASAATDATAEPLAFARLRPGAGKVAFAQATLIAGNGDGSPTRVITGNCPFTTEGLGITPGNQFSLIQSAESPEECVVLGAWFTGLWNSLPASPEPKRALLARLKALMDHCEPALIYFLVLYHLFKDLGDELDEERIVKSATGIRNTTVWKKLFKFQRDGVIGAIDKLERFGGVIIADSVGLGKTFTALAVVILLGVLSYGGMMGMIDDVEASLDHTLDELYFQDFVVTVEGTAASLVSLLAKLTTNGKPRSVLLRVTWPVVVPPFSEKDDEMLRLSVS